VIHVLSTWINEYYEDFMEAGMRKPLDDFIAVLAPNFPQHASQLKAIIFNKTDKITIEAERMKKYFANLPPVSKVDLKNLFSPYLNIFDCDDEELSRQMTLLDFNLFRSLSIQDISTMDWQKPNARQNPRMNGILTLIDRSNRFSEWVASSILKEEGLKKRANLVERFIKIAQILKNFNNGLTCISILTGIHTSSIQRLRWTFAELSKKSLSILAELDDLMSPNANFSKYRAKLSTTKPPCMPYIGLILRDVAVVYDGNINFTTTGLINFNLRNLLWQSSLNFLPKFLHKPYNFNPVHQIAVLLETKALHLVGEEELYKQSMLREPRSAQKSQLVH